ncbi:hypothetical protein RUND412_008442 [Rhizina undulata]
MVRQRNSTWFFILLLPYQFATSEARRNRPCTCYRTSTFDYFTNHAFYDFRNIGDFSSETPALPSVLPQSINPSDYSDEPDGIGITQAGFLNSTDWTDHWNPQDWGKLPTSDAPVRMQNSLGNVYVADGNNSDSSSMLVLRAHRFSDFQSTAEVESLTRNLFYASIRIHARVYGAAGAVAGLFTYESEVEESDIEILTRDPDTRIRYSNQPVLDDEGNEIPGSSTEVDLNTNLQIDGTQMDQRRRQADDDYHWTNWNTHRVDWKEGLTSWFIEDKHLLDKTIGVPNVPSYFVMNLWSDGGIWSGNMTEGETAFMEIQWIEMVYNTSGPASGYVESSGSSSKAKMKRDLDDRQCEVVCVVDGVSEAGVPEGSAGTTVVGWTLLMLAAGIGIFGAGILGI